MSKNLLQPQNQQNTSADETMLCVMCWFLLITIIVWLFLALVITVVILWHTQNPLNVSVFPPLASPAYFLYRILKPLLPMNEKKYQLAKIQVEMLQGVPSSGVKNKYKSYRG